MNNIIKEINNLTDIKQKELACYCALEYLNMPLWDIEKSLFKNYLYSPLMGQIMSSTNDFDYIGEL